MSSRLQENTGNIKANLVIVGGGGAGLAAALAAAEKGLRNIVVLEKRSATGGTSAMASGIFAADSPTQKRQAIIARKDDLFKRMMDWTHLTANPRIIRAFINRSGETIRWLEEKGLFFFCVPHSPIDMPLTWHVPRGNGAEIMQVLTRECSERGVETMLGCSAKKLLVGTKGNVTEVIAEQDGKSISIKTESVIIATGGFGGNKKMLRKYCPKYRESMRLSGLPHQGDGILIATEAGAAADGLGMLMSAGPFAGVGGVMKLGTGPDTVPVQLTFITGEPYVIWVNKTGRRFIDETASYNYYECINALIQQPESICYTLFDAGVLKMINENGFSNVPSGYVYGEPQRRKLPPGLDNQLKQLSEKGTIKRADTWNDIAAWIGCESRVLRDTIDEYNTGCNQGHDPVFGKDRAYLMPLGIPPYYALKCGSSMLNTIGGIKVNENMEVIDKKDKSIPGLYAAGVDVGGWTSDTYCAILPGIAFGFAINSGRIAGETAAEFISRVN